MYTTSQKTRKRPQLSLCPHKPHHDPQVSECAHTSFAIQCVAGGSSCSVSCLPNFCLDSYSLCPTGSTSSVTPSTSQQQQAASVDQDPWLSQPPSPSQSPPSQAPAAEQDPWLGNTLAQPPQAPQTDPIPVGDGSAQASSGEQDAWLSQPPAGDSAELDRSGTGQVAKAGTEGAGVASSREQDDWLSAGIQTCAPPKHACLSQVQQMHFCSGSAILSSQRAGRVKGRWWSEIPAGMNHQSDLSGRLQWPRVMQATIRDS